MSCRVSSLTWPILVPYSSAQDLADNSWGIHDGTVQRYQPRAEYLDTGKDHDNPPTCYSPSNSILFVQTHTSLRKCPPQLGHFGRPLWVVSRFPQRLQNFWCVNKGTPLSDRVNSHLLTYWKTTLLRNATLGERILLIYWLMCQDLN